MTTLQSHVPASFHSHTQSRRAVPGNLKEDSRPYLIPGRKGRTTSTSFLALAKEPEDAKITGATRSLDRRLLALNLRGSLSNGSASMISISTMTVVRISMSVIVIHLTKLTN